MGPRFGRCARAISLPALAPTLLWAALQAPPSVAVGLPARWTDVVVPGTELEVRASAEIDPLVLRITRAAPHGSAFRYDFEYTGLEPGSYDLLAALRRKDGSALDAAAEQLPRLEVAVHSTLPVGQIQPRAPQAGTWPRLGGYLTWLSAGTLAWLLGLVWILRSARPARRVAPLASAPPPTLAERLRPLVASALSRELGREERAQLELGLHAFWRRKLGLEGLPPAESAVRLRAHPEAGALLAQLESWLHRPDPPSSVDLETLLRPYASLPPEAMPEIEASAPKRTLPKAP